MLKTVKVIGKASNKELTFLTNEVDLEMTLINFLVSKNLPIASSCRFEGVCRKCVVHSNVLSCQITLREYIETYGILIEIDYL